MRRCVTGVIGVLLFAFAACAVITVNIYFPEKDVKEAYKVLEKELMGTDKKPDEIKPEGKPEVKERHGKENR